MAEKHEITPEKLEEILNRAVDLTENHSTYTTNIRFRVSNNEVTLDLFYMGPNPRNPPGDPEAYRTHRIVLSPSLAKNIGQLLLKAMTEWEESFGVTLPLSLDEDTAEVIQDE